MGTRGVIARLTERKVKGNIYFSFKGRYHHWDSYPSGLGKTLYNLYNEFFNKDLVKMLKVLIDDHPAGWSTINGADFSLNAGWIGNSGADYENKEVKKQPVCYCHGDRHEDEWLCTDKNASGSGCEWAYAFDTKKKLMKVFASMTIVNDKTVKMIGAWGMGDPKATWIEVATVNLDDKEPDWNKMEKV